MFRSSAAVLVLLGCGPCNSSPIGDGTIPVTSSSVCVCVCVHLVSQVQSEARILGGFVSPDLHKLVTWGSALLMFLLAMNVVDNGANTHPSLSDRGE